MLRERRRHANFKPNRRLDRKSSRGMIYENEELRLRTININAEVERGQSDIRKLRRENEQLRREIWSLRDEYDRLNKLLRANRSTESCGGGGGENNGNNSGTQDEESDSCDTCKEDDGEDDIVCDEKQCELHNKIKCDHHHYHHQDTTQQYYHQQQHSSSSCNSETKHNNKKLITSSSLPASSPSSLSNNGSREITENYENLQKSIITDNNSGNYKNCSNISCTSSSSSSSCGGSGGGGGVVDSGTDISGKALNAIRNSDGYCANISSCADGSNATGGTSDKLRENLHVNFDHLSIVSEENLTNSDGNSIQQNDIDPPTPSTSGIGGTINLQESTISTTKSVITSDTSQKNLNRMSDIESLVPPLSHFENISYEKIGPSLADLEDVNYSRSTTATGDTVIAANGWDFSVASITKSLTTHHDQNVKSKNQDISSTNHSKLIANEMATTSSPFKVTQHLLDTKPFSSSSFLSTERSRSPKHFFAPLKPRLHVDIEHSSSPSPSSPLPINTFQQKQQHHHQNCNGPDVFVTNALASSSSYHSNIHTSPPKNSSQSDIEPLYASVQKPSLSSSRKCSASSFQTGGNLEDLLMDIETLSKDILQMQLQKQKSLSEDKLDNGGDDTTETGCLSNRKPFRSEMNLVLTYNGTNPVITPIMKSTTSTSLNCGFGMSCSDGAGGGNGVDEKDFSTATTMERGSVRGTPPLPNVPEPMMLFPENRPYLGFENFGQPPISSLASGKSVLSIFSKAHQDKSQPETPGVEDTVIDNKLPPSVNSSNSFDTNPTNEEFPVITTVAAAAALTTSNTPNRNENKLAEMGSADKGLKQQHSFDKKRNNLKESRTESFASETANCDSSSGSESTIKRKSRRVSILFRKSEESAKEAKKENGKNEKEYKTETLTTKVMTVEAKSDRTTAIVNSENPQAITANNPNNIQGSPHSDRHRTNSSLTSRHHHHHHHHHHQGHKMNQDSSTTAKHLSKLPSSITPVGQTAISNFDQQQQHQQSKNGRRHSDGTVLATISGGCASDTSGGGIIGSSSAHHHHHHHHSHAGLAANSGPSRHHHTRHDSYNDGGGGGTSISERNSNSLASSRESSTSLSTRSHRRKISISSHSGGKIPWCGCWGNGCL